MVILVKDNSTSLHLATFKIFPTLNFYHLYEEVKSSLLCKPRVSRLQDVGQMWPAAHFCQ